MQLNGGASGGFQAEINVTPLVDVVLVLLIIFMVILPLTLRSYEMDIPGEAAVETAIEPDEAEQIVLAIEVDNCPMVAPPEQPGLPVGCRVRINDETFPVTELGYRVQEIFQPRQPEDRVLFLAAESALNYEGVMRIVDAAKNSVAGLRMGLVTERESA